MTLNVLVADGGGASAAALSHMMSRDGCAVRNARDGDAALAEAAARRPDLVVLDAATPGRDVFEVCRRMRADPSLRGVPIVMLSARCAEHDAEKAAALGADLLISKPFSCRAVAAQLRAMMDVAEMGAAS
ncbi:MAG: response regulator [Rubrimonas sp.]|uniref:response regulator n=1 Tax=Rubrimonas sp. TaxID=2036015 RepID=UPI002FDEAEF9